MQGKKNFFHDIVAFLLVMPSMAVFRLGFVCTIANCDSWQGSTEGRMFGKGRVLEVD